MRPSTALPTKALPLPRGLVIVGAALASWALVALAWVVASALFGFVLGAI